MKKVVAIIMTERVLFLKEQLSQNRYFCNDNRRHYCVGWTEKICIAA